MWPVYVDSYFPFFLNPFKCNCDPAFCPLGGRTQVPQKMNKNAFQKFFSVYISMLTSAKSFYSHLEVHPIELIPNYNRDITHVWERQKPQKPKFDLRHSSSTIQK